MSAGRFCPLLDSVNGGADLVKGFFFADIRGQESSAAGPGLLGSGGVIDGRKSGNVPIVRVIVRHLWDDGVLVVLGVDSCFLAFTPADGPASCSTPVFYAVELRADDFDLDFDPIFPRPVFEALVMYAAPVCYAGFRDLHRTGLVSTEDVRDNLAQVAAWTVAP